MSPAAPKLRCWRANKAWCERLPAPASGLSHCAWQPQCRTRTASCRVPWRQRRVALRALQCSDWPGAAWCRGRKRPTRRRPGAGGPGFAALDAARRSTPGTDGLPSGARRGFRQRCRDVALGRRPRQPGSDVTTWWRWPGLVALVAAGTGVVGGADRQRGGPGPSTCRQPAVPVDQPLPGRFAFVLCRGDSPWPGAALADRAHRPARTGRAGLAQRGCGAARPDAVR